MARISVECVDTTLPMATGRVHQLGGNIDKKPSNRTQILR